VSIEFEKQGIRIEIHPILAKCYNFENGRPRTVVISPVAVWEEKGRVLIGYACSLGPWCTSVCRYSRVKTKPIQQEQR
jgi:hypothetical protein